MDRENEEFANLATPLREFIQPVIHAPLIAAPERRDELAELLTKHALSQEIRMENGYWFTALRLANQVRTSLPALERIWAYSYVSMLVHTRMEATGFKGSVKLAGDKEGDDARELLRWALLTEFEAGSSDWPTHLPRPDKPRADTGLLQGVNNLFITTVGFAHLHEIGHVVLKHGWNSQDDDIQNEFAADEWAYTWMLEKVPYESHREKYLQRTMFISFGLAILSSITFWGPKEVAKITHPNPIDRLLRFLSKHADESHNDLIHPRLVACTVVQLHISNADDFDPAQKASSARVFLESQRDRFQQRQA